MLVLFSILVLFLGHSLASPSANQYVDSVIYTTLQNVIRSEKLDPTHLQDFTYEYKDKTMFVKVGGKAEYTEGKLAGLSKVQRYSECEGPRNISGSTIINCTLSFNILETTYKGKVKYGVLPKVSITPKGDVRLVILNVGIAKPISGGKAHVKSFSFRGTGSMNTTFTGLGPLNKQMKILEENYRERVGAEVKKVIDSRFQYALNLAVAEVPMPVH